MRISRITPISYHVLTQIVLSVDAQKAAEMFFKMRHYELWTHLLERLLRLRQMCNHWSLCKKKGMDNCRKELHGLLRASGGSPDESQLGELLQLSLEAKISCGFCNEPIDLECFPVICPCAHVYCKACIVMPFQETLACPVCKARFSAAEITEMGSVPKSAFEVPSQLEHSTKTKTLISLVKQRLQNRGSKIVIFSQWTSFLDIVAHHLDGEDIRHVRIDGTMSTSLRDEAAKALDKDPNVRVLLASLRAAGVGINLVAADTAILADSCMLKPPPLRRGPCLLTKSRVGSRYRGTGRRQGAPPRPDPDHKGIPACRQKFRRGGRGPNPGSKEGACRDGLPGKVQGPIRRELLGHGQRGAWLGGLGECPEKFCRYGWVCCVRDSGHPTSPIAFFPAVCVF